MRRLAMSVLVLAAMTTFCGGCASAEVIHIQSGGDLAMMGPAMPGAMGGARPPIAERPAIGDPDAASARRNAFPSPLSYRLGAGDELGAALFEPPRSSVALGSTHDEPDRNRPFVGEPLLAGPVVFDARSCGGVCCHLQPDASHKHGLAGTILLRAITPSWVRAGAMVRDWIVATPTLAATLAPERWRISADAHRSEPFATPSKRALNTRVPAPAAFSAFVRSSRVPSPAQ